MTATLFLKDLNPGHSHEQVAYPGDDLPDLSAIRHIGGALGNLEAAHSAFL